MRDRLADDLVRKKHWQLIALCAAIIAGGLACSWWQGNFMPLARSGALLTAASIIHAWRSLRWSRMMVDVEKVVIDIFTKIERDKLTGLDADTQAVVNAVERVSSRMPGLITAVERRFVADHLLVGFIGTLLWGFADLIPFP
ncbi:hypothetical protein [Mesorhizobium sp.]|uniref:hypothetical protein n=1 Tax=Mesorhizobium sp. TaxID=1871066 RepID=UPI000FE4B50E|nr:hypothetical protein [Mesorhizobium sp.]RWM28497.1 MAG: hypothetical protein EOR74_09210 [Mesorhizobium sp.]